MIRKLLQKFKELYQYRYLARHEKGAYHFLLQKIYKSTDLNFLQHAWQLDYFREVLVPTPLALEPIKKVLVLAPHQDDEVLGCGGTLCRLSQLGCSVQLLFLTDGAELSNPDKSVQIRKKESENVANALKAQCNYLGISNITFNISEAAFGKLVGVMNEGWDAICSIWPLDGPAKHRLCSYLVGKAVSISNYKGSILFYAVHTELLPNKYIDITEIVHQKKQLISLYPSQLKAQNYQHLSNGLDAWRSRFLPISEKARYLEVFMEIPAESYQDFQELYERSIAAEVFKEMKCV